MFFDLEETWPKDLLDFLDEQSSTLRGYEDHENQTLEKYLSPDNELSMSMMPENPFFEEREKIVEKINILLMPEHLVGWHCTKLTHSEIHKIKSSGMCLPTLKFLEERIFNLINEGIISLEVGEKLKTNNWANDANRKEMIWFCFFPPRMAGQSGIENFFRYWGGEALYRLHQDNSETGPVLMNIGIPCLIEAQVPISSLALNFFAEKIARHYLVRRGLKPSEGTKHEDRSLLPIAAENILRIIEFGHEDFVSLTGCNKWHPPL